MTTMYGKFEANFSVTTPATNLYLPYDAAPPLSITPGVGVTVDALFLAPSVTDWASAIVQPCFWYQPVTLASVSGQQQGIVTGAGTWKVRFQPKQTGTWQVRIRVIDANGTTLLPISTFSVSAAAAGAHGCLRVAVLEPSVFEFEDGTPYFPVGHNGGNASTLPAVLSNNVNLERIWLSNYRLFATGHGDNSAPWTYFNITDFDHFFRPLSSGAPSTFGVRLFGGTNTSAINTASSSSCATDAYLSCKRSTQYRWSTWVNTSGLSATGVFTVKLGPYSTPGVSVPGVTATLSAITDSRRIITTTAGAAPTTWTQYTGTYTTGATEDFFGGGSGGANPYLYLALEGSTTGYVEFTIPVVQEVLAGPSYGPNQLDLATGALDQYSQLGSAMVDSLVADAESKGIAIKAVIEDKNDVAWKYLNANGTIATLPDGDLGNIVSLSESGLIATCQVSGTTSGLNANSWVSIQAGNYTGEYQPTVVDATHFTFTAPFSGLPTLSSGTVAVINFYNPLHTTPTGWLQKAYARYLTARWGYSWAIHSWEHVNEGDSGAAPTQFTDALAAYFHSIDPNKHLVSTSTASGLSTATYWAKMQNVDYQDFHGYLDTGELKAVDWQLPPGTWTWVTDATYPGALRMDASTAGQAFGATIQEAGTWTIAFDANTLSTTGGTFGVTSDQGTSQLLAAGSDWTTLSTTFVSGSAIPKVINLTFGDGTHSGGSALLRNFKLISPGGKRLVTWVGDGLFPAQTDTSKDMAAFHTAYDQYATRFGQGLHGKPIMQSEWSPGLGNSNAYTAGITSDTNLVWLHTSQFARLGPGNLHDLWWILAANDLVTANNGWGKYGQFLSFAGALPLNNGHYADIAATTSGQTNGTVVVVGQKDTTNNRAHMWVRHQKFTWGNAVNAPTAWLPGGVAGQILTGTVAFSGLTAPAFTLSIYEFSAVGVLSISTRTLLPAGNLFIDLSTLQPTTTDVAFSLNPTTLTISSTAPVKGVGG